MVGAVHLCIGLYLFISKVRLQPFGIDLILIVVDSDYYSQCVPGTATSELLSSYRTA